MSSLYCCVCEEQLLFSHAKGAHKEAVRILSLGLNLLIKLVKKKNLVEASIICQLFISEHLFRETWLKLSDIDFATVADFSSIMSLNKL